MTVAIDSASFKGSLPYPSIKALSARSHIGGQHDPASGGVLRGTGLRGRVGAVYLLDEHVKDEQMCALHTRGPDCAAACRLSSSSLLLDPAWEGSLLSHNRVMLLLHPSRLHNSPCPSSCSSSTGDFQMEVEEAGWVSDSFFDSAWEWRGRPLLEMVRDRGQQDGWVGEQQQPALLGRGVVAVARSSVTDALDCVSGAKVSGMWCVS